MANEWHYTQNNQPVATPVSAEELKQLAGSGRLQPADLVWTDGMPGWVPASTIKGLFSASRSSEIPAASPSDSARERAEPSRPREKEKPKEKEKEKPVKKKPPRPSDTGDLTGSSAMLEMHPALVFLLSVVTFGIFGILYAIKASSTLAKFANKRAVDSANRPLGDYQHPIRILIFSFLTLGFYFPFWVSRAMRECNAYTGRSGLGGRLEFCLMLVIPLYSFYVVGFRLVPRVREVQARASISDDERLNPLAALLAGGILMPVFGMGAWIMGMGCQEALNEAWQTAA